MTKALQVVFDTEFTGLQKDTDLISIGCITKDGHVFYGQTTDYDAEKASEATQEFIKETIEPSLFSSISELINSDLGKLLLDTDNPNNITIVIDTYENVSKQFQEWVKWIWEESNDEYEVMTFVSDVAHYDAVLLIDMLSGGKDAFQIPTFVCPAIYDIMFDIHLYLFSAPVLSTKRLDYFYDAFDINRETFVVYLMDSMKTDLAMKYSDTRPNFLVNHVLNAYSKDPDKFKEFMVSSKHSSIFDALVIYLIYQFLIVDVIEEDL